MTQLRNVSSFILLASIQVVTACDIARADSPCSYDEAAFGDNIRFTFVNNTGTSVTTNGNLVLPLTGPNDCGDVVQHPLFYSTPGGSAMCPCADRPQNCEGDCYSYMEANIPNTFSLTVNVAFTNPDGTAGSVSITFTKAHINAYYDHKYEGYTKTGDVDFSQNCHGLALGVGNWPGDSTYGAERILNSPTCWFSAYIPDVKLAYSGNHSIVVGGEICDGGLEETMPFPQFTSSQEKFRASAIYSQSSTCGLPGVNISKAHPGLSFTFWQEW